MSRIDDAIKKIPRRFFVGEEYYKSFWKDVAIPIGHGVNSTKPSQVKRMLEFLDPAGKVLEIGTGCGWQTAILSELSDVVYSIEYDERLYERALHNLKGYPGFLVRGDGFKGLPHHAPFDRIICCAAVKEISPDLMDQLSDGGIMVAPVGDAANQKLVKIVRSGDSFDIEELELCGFVVAQ